MAGHPLDAIVSEEGEELRPLKARAHDFFYQCVAEWYARNRTMPTHLYIQTRWWEDEIAPMLSDSVEKLGMNVVTFPLFEEGRIHFTDVLVNPRDMWNHIRNQPSR